MKNYLIHIQLQQRTKSELTEFGQLLKKILDQHTESNQIAYTNTTPDGHLFSVVAHSKKTANTLRMMIDGNSPITQERNQPKKPTTGFKNGNKIIIYELGADVSENGFNTVRTWLSRHARL